MFSSPLFNLFTVVPLHVLFIPVSLCLLFPLTPLPLSSFSSLFSYLSHFLLFFLTPLLLFPITVPFLLFFSCISFPLLFLRYSSPIVFYHRCISPSVLFSSMFFPALSPYLPFVPVHTNPQRHQFTVFPGHCLLGLTGRGVQELPRRAAGTRHLTIMQAKMRPSLASRWCVGRRWILGAWESRLLSRSRCRNVADGELMRKTDTRMIDRHTVLSDAAIPYSNYIQRLKRRFIGF